MRFGFLIFFVSVLFFVSCDNCFLTKKDDILAVVNGKCITKHYFFLKAKLYDLKIQNYEQAYNFLNFVINNILLLQNIKKNKIKITKKEINNEIENFIPGYTKKEIKGMIKVSKINYSDWINDLKEKILIKKGIEHIAGENIKIKDEELKDYYWSNIVNYRKIKKVRARQIVVLTKEKADEILIKLKNGENFGKLANEFSITSESENGGDLGYFGEKDMPDFIVKTVFSLKVGEISNIVRSDYGFHIFKCEDIKEATTPEFEDIKEEIYKDFFEMKKNSYFNIMMENLRKNAKIIIYKENLKKTLEIEEEK